MPAHSSSHRVRRVPSVPRAGVDPITSAVDALAVVTMALSSPPGNETVAFYLDDAGCGAGPLLVVADTVDHDAMLDVVDLMGRMAAPNAIVDRTLTGLVVASCRPGGRREAADALRWRRASDLADQHCLTLVEWFVLGVAGVEYPRELTREPERWLAA